MSGLGTGSVLAYTRLPPPTPDPEPARTSLSSVSRRMPWQKRLGIHRNRRTFQLVRAKSDAFQRLPASSTATRWPFSASRSAATEPPKPDPTTRTSYLSIAATPGMLTLSAGGVNHSYCGRRGARACYARDGDPRRHRRGAGHGRKRTSGGMDALVACRHRVRLGLGGPRHRPRQRAARLLVR